MKVLGMRALLNKPGFCTTAAIVAEVEDTSEWKPGRDKRGKRLERNIEPYTTLQVSDCYRAITFEIHWHSAKERKNVLHKLDTMIAALTAFRDGVEAEQERYAERNRYLKKNGKGKKQRSTHSWRV